MKVDTHCVYFDTQAFYAVKPVDATHDVGFVPCINVFLAE
jgi:hypothetical protein